MSGSSPPGLLGVSGPLGVVLERISAAILHHLAQPSGTYQPFSAPQPKLLARCLQPGDVLLVEGNTRLSGIIKYLTQSTWSHATLYVGPDIMRAEDVDLQADTLLEAEAQEGVRLSPISKYAKFNTRICRPFGLAKEERRKVVDFALKNVGKQYDSRHIGRKLFGLYRRQTRDRTRDGDRRSALRNVSR